MPTYEFRCPQGHEFEKFYRSIGGAESIAACPACGEGAERVMSPTGFAFKGSGFYLTDYGKNAHRDKGTPVPKSGAPAGEGGGAAQGESATKGESGAGGAGASGASDSGGETKKPEPKAAESKAAESKPAPAAPKKSTGE